MPLITKVLTVKLRTTTVGMWAHIPEFTSNITFTFSTDLTMTFDQQQRYCRCPQHFEDLKSSLADGLRQYCPKGELCTLYKVESTGTDYYDDGRDRWLAELYHHRRLQLFEDLKTLLLNDFHLYFPYGEMKVPQIAIMTGSEVRTEPSGIFSAWRPIPKVKTVEVEDLHQGPGA